MHEFTDGLLMHAPGWHRLGHVLEEFPGKEKGKELAGHNFTVVERDLMLPSTRPVAASMESIKLPKLFEKYGNLHITEDGVFSSAPVPGYKALVKSMPDEKRPTWLGDDDVWTPTDGMIFAIPRDSYGVVQNDTGWEIAELLVGEGAQFETALSLRGGAVCVVLAYLPEPYIVPGDDSVVLPFVCVSWSHDGSGAFRAESTSVRVVCMNTLKYSEMVSDKLNTGFVFRHSTNINERIEDAKLAIRGIRDTQEKFIELTNELIKIQVTEKQRETFVQQFIPMPISGAMLSDRQKLNIEEGRELVRSILDGPSVPDAHRFTGYGLHLAGVEYLDHYRGARTQETIFNRQILRTETMKTNLKALIEEVATP